MSDIECPHCDCVQIDCTTGGDPGDWWGDEYMPYGQLRHECDDCNKEFTVLVSWSPSFEGVVTEDD